MPNNWRAGDGGGGELRGVRMIVRPAAIVDAIDGVDKPWGQSGGGSRGVGTGSASVPVPVVSLRRQSSTVFRVLNVPYVLGIRRPPPLLAEDIEDAEDVEDADDSGRRNTSGRRAE